MHQRYRNCWFLSNRQALQQIIIIIVDSLIFSRWKVKLIINQTTWMNDANETKTKWQKWKNNGQPRHQLQEPTYRKYLTFIIIKHPLHVEIERKCRIDGSNETAGGLWHNNFYENVHFSSHFLKCTRVNVVSAAKFRRKKNYQKFIFSIETTWTVSS